MWDEIIAAILISENLIENVDDTIFFYYNTKTENIFLYRNTK